MKVNNYSDQEKNNFFKDGIFEYDLKAIWKLLKTSFGAMRHDPR